MDKFCLVAIMLFAIQRDMADHSIVDVIDALDRDRDILNRADFLELVFADAMYKHLIYDESFGIYDKYFNSEQFRERVSPF